MDKRILWVDDDAHEIESLIHPLKQYGFEIIVALDGKDALHLLEKERIDLIILDLFLKRPDSKGNYKKDYWKFKDLEGVIFAELIKKNRSQIPVLIFSVYSEGDRVIKRLKDCGINEFFLKPDSRLLIERCKVLLT